MLLGKRPRRTPTLRRTTSMGGIALAVEADDHDDDDEEELPSHDPQQQLRHDPPYPHDMPMDPSAMTMNVTGAKGFYQHDERFVISSFPSSSSSSTTTASKVNSSHNMPTAHFLRICGLCERALAPAGRDIYMYRGDTAFCSSECREKHMRQDEKKEKWTWASNKDVRSASPPTAPSDDPTTTKTIVAAST